MAPSNKLRPKSLFVTPTVLNDAAALSKLQHHRSPTHEIGTHTPSSSSTICDAESILTSSSSSLPDAQRRRMPLYNSLPSLNAPQPVETTAREHQPAFSSDMTNSNNNNNNNESGPELDPISDFTSKMFSSGEEEDEEGEEDEDVGLGVSDTSSTSTIPSEAK